MSVEKKCLKAAVRGAGDAGSTKTVTRLAAKEFCKTNCTNGRCAAASQFLDKGGHDMVLRKLGVGDTTGLAIRYVSGGSLKLNEPSN